jgi:hypothetical protein
MLIIDLYYNGLTVPAYIDPGTGSLMIQVLIGVLAGSAVAAKIYWARVKSLVRNLFSARSNRIEDGEQST